MTRSTPSTRRSFLVGAGAAVLAPLAPRIVDAQALGIDAARFGIQPDRETDQTAVIQRALDETRLTETPLFLPPGRYAVSGLRLGRGARLAGIPGATRLAAIGGAPLISAEGAERVALDGIVLDGMARDLGSAEGLVDLADVAEVRIADCEVVNSWGDGIMLRRCSGQVRATTVSGARGTGLFSLDGSDLDISHNRVHDCGDNGIMVWQSARQGDGARIANNHVTRIHNRSGGTGQYGNGIVVFRGAGVTISGNRIAECSFSAVRINAGADVIVSGNNCARLGEVAIFVEFGFDGAVVADNLVNGALHGISVTNFDQGGRLAVVSGNLVRNIEIGAFPEPRGTGIFVSADTTLTGNVVENAARSGYGLGYGPYLRDVVATGNIARDCPIGFEVSVVQGVRSTVIANNLISGASRAAILGMRWEEPATGDLAQGGTEDYPELTIRDNRMA
jgi:uncharacterized secreted repeat protein (TIGR03808 family)